MGRTSSMVEMGCTGRGHFGDRKCQRGDRDRLDNALSSDRLAFLLTAGRMDSMAILICSLPMVRSLRRVPACLEGRMASTVSLVRSLQLAGLVRSLP